MECCICGPFFGSLAWIPPCQQLREPLALTMAFWIKGVCTCCCFLFLQPPAFLILSGVFVWGSGTNLMCFHPLLTRISDMCQESQTFDCHIIFCIWNTSILWRKLLFGWLILPPHLGMELHLPPCLLSLYLSDGEMPKHVIKYVVDITGWKILTMGRNFTSISWLIWLNLKPVQPIEHL